MPGSDIFAAIRWWVVLMGLGTAVFPLSYHLFNRLPDRGYAFTKMMGLLLVSYVFWLLGSLGFLGNNMGGIAVAVVIVLAASVWAYRREAGLPEWLRANWRQILITELVFAAVFGLWVWVRAQNPAIINTEKPMEFAFLNAAGHSPSFPPLDPWLAGYAISYYYFGYVMISVVARLAAVAEPIAFNLGIAWLVAGTAVGAFGLVYNLVMNGEESVQVPGEQVFKRKNAVLLGLIAAIALPLAGNQQITLEILHANGVGSAEFWATLDIRDVNTPAVVDETPRYTTSAWWWWRSSRVIHEYHLSGRAEEGLEPIAEFPGFSFVLGDMHPHVLALPFAFLSLAVAFAWWQGGSSEQYSVDSEQYSVKRGLSGQVRELVEGVGWPLWVFTVILLGGLSFLNTWDVLIHLFVVLGAFVLGQWRRYGWNGRILEQAVMVALLLIIPAAVLYFPFYIGFRSQAGAPFLLPMLMHPTRLAQYLVIFGMPLLTIVLWVVGLVARQKFRYWKQGVITAVSLILGLFLLMVLLGWIVAASAEYGRVTALAQEVGLVLPPRPAGTVAFGWGISAVFALLPVVLSAKLAAPGLTLFLALLAGLVMMAWLNLLPPNQPTKENSTPSSLPFVLLLVATGALLTLGPEFVYLKDNFGQRLNTVFKFYYQAWVMFGIAAIVALHYVWQVYRGFARIVSIIGTVGYGAMLAVAMLFPYYGTASRAAEFRGPITAEIRAPLTLNGLAFMQQTRPDEYEAVLWLRQTVTEPAIILEAVGGQYSDFGRISASTGLPTLLGWAGHEHQWRGSSTPDTGALDRDIRELYSTTNWQRTADLLNRYQVEYIYIGHKEREAYGPQIQEKFDANGAEVAYQNETVIIYRWKPVGESGQ